MKVKQNKQITIMLMGYQRCHIGYLTVLEDFPLTPRRCLLFFSMHMVVAGELESEVAKAEGRALTTPSSCCTARHTDASAAGKEIVDCINPTFCNVR